MNALAQPPRSDMLDEFSSAILLTMAQLSACVDALNDAPNTPAGTSPGTQISVPRLTKRLGISASALMRQLTLMSSASIGGQAGPGWVRITQHEGRWWAELTDAGIAVLPSNRQI